MVGDSIVIQEHHINAAKKVVDIIYPKFKDYDKVIITVGGQAGSGKSEIGRSISNILEEEKGVKSTILQQDDYYVYPPLTNAKKRREDISWVGMGEVKLDLINQNIKSFLADEKSITKPLVSYKEDKIEDEVIEFGDSKVLIVEGTFTTSLDNVTFKVFIDRTYIETKKHRLLRAREEQDDHLEQVLKIEHEIVSKHKDIANVVVTKEWDVYENK